MSKERLYLFDTTLSARPPADEKRRGRTNQKKAVARPSVTP
jgi:hypothetical protein